LACSKKLLGGVLVFPFESIHQGNPGIISLHISPMEIFEEPDLRPEFQKYQLRKGNRPVFQSLVVMNSQYPRIEVEAMNTQTQTLEKAQPASVQHLDDQVIGRRKVP
jgi:hypothetical protein